MRNEKHLEGVKILITSHKGKEKERGGDDIFICLTDPEKCFVAVQPQNIKLTAPISPT